MLSRLIGLVLVWSAIPSWCQPRTIVGRVVDAETQRPIANANVVVLGTTEGSITNHLGFFSLTLEKETAQELVISHIGFKTSKVQVPESDNFKVLLQKEYLDIAEFDLAFFNPIDLPLMKKDSTFKAEKESGEFYQVEVDAEYPGGWDYFFTDLGSMIIDDSVFRLGMDSVLIKFEVDGKGNSVVEETTGDSLKDKDYFTRLFSRLPKWRPAKQRGRAVSQYFTLPLKWSEEVFTIIEEPARPLGGMPNFYKFIGDNLRYPAQARSALVGGRVFVEFIINEDGKISDTKVVSGIGYGCDEEAIRVISMAPNWQPGLAKGKPVKQRLVMPITFSTPGQRTIPSRRPLGEASDFYKFLGENVMYPSLARQSGVEGWVVLQFELDEDAKKAKNILIIEDIGGKCGDEIARVIQVTPWEILAGIRSIKPSADKFVLPVGFGLGQKVKTSIDLLKYDEAMRLEPLIVTAQGIERERRVTGAARSFDPNSTESKPFSEIKYDFQDLQSFLTQNIRYPLDARRFGKEGWVIVEFSLDTLSNRIGDFNILNNVAGGCGDEVIRVLKEAPAKLLENLKKDGTEFILPVGFGLEEPLNFELVETTTNSKLLSIVNIVARGNGIQPVSGGPNGTFRSFQTAFKLPLEVSSISIVNKGISEIPSDIGLLLELKSLDLEMNKIKEIPAEINELAKLEEVFLRSNHIIDLPKDISGLKSLTTLGLTANRFEVFPKQLTQLKSLEALDLSGNKITEIPPEIGEMQQLKLLYLKDNLIKDFPEDFFRLTQLEKLYLKGNPLKKDIKQKLRLRLPNTEIIL
ncbi:MAG: TonB family protein [Cyclobacteriaceae bacterium]